MIAARGAAHVVVRSWQPEKWTRPHSVHGGHDHKLRFRCVLRGQANRNKVRTHKVVMKHVWSFRRQLERLQSSRWLC